MSSAFQFTKCLPVAARLRRRAGGPCARPAFRVQGWVGGFAASLEQGCFSLGTEWVDSWTPGLKRRFHRYRTGPLPSGLLWTPSASLVLTARPPKADRSRIERVWNRRGGVADLGLKGPSMPMLSVLEAFRPWDGLGLGRDQAQTHGLGGAPGLALQRIAAARPDHRVDDPGPGVIQGGPGGCGQSGRNRRKR